MYLIHIIHHLNTMSPLRVAKMQAGRATDQGPMAGRLGSAMFSRTLHEIARDLIEAPLHSSPVLPSPIVTKIAILEPGDDLSWSHRGANSFLPLRKHLCPVRRILTPVRYMRCAAILVPLLSTKDSLGGHGIMRESVDDDSRPEAAAKRARDQPPDESHSPCQADKKRKKKTSNGSLRKEN